MLMRTIPSYRLDGMRASERIGYLIKEIEVQPHGPCSEYTYYIHTVMKWYGVQNIAKRKTALSWLGQRLA